MSLYSKKGEADSRDWLSCGLSTMEVCVCMCVCVCVCVCVGGGEGEGVLQTVNCDAIIL